jgi:enamine deaminase RidA (YjgF/YER057c/UK114 family)
MIEEKLKELGIELPQPAKPLAAYIPGIRIGDKIMTSGQVPLQNGTIKYTGKVGKDLTEEEGKKAAEICVLNCLSIVNNIAGSLDAVSRIVKLTVFVNSAAGFTNQPEVANGASELVEKIFGEKGKHVRSAVGVSELPRNSAVEIEMTVSLG